MSVRRAIVEISTGKVTNIITYDSTKDWEIPSGYELLSESESLLVSIGDTWNGTTIIKSEVTVVDKYANTIINAGSYLGDNTTDRVITHGLKIKPKVIWIQITSGKAFIMIVAASTITSTSEKTGLAVKTADEINFYVGNKLNLEGTANLSGNTYYWIAMS